MYMQNTMYDTSKVVFARVPKINDVEIRMPNIHYYVADLSKLKVPNSGEVHVTACIFEFSGTPLRWTPSSPYTQSLWPLLKVACTKTVNLEPWCLAFACTCNIDVGLYLEGH